MGESATSAPLSVLGRYALYGEIASGGMATVHLGRLLGPVGFARTVAIKRLHPHYAKDPEFVAMFLDEARLAARIRHPNVVPTLDVVALKGELFLVMEYVQGESLARLIRAARHAHEQVPPEIAAAVLVHVLHGLHAAHEAKDERGAPLGIVHRDMSPHNVLVGVDGIARVLDFGVAKAAGRIQSTREGGLKGKLAYMAPEQVEGVVSRASDVYAAGIVLWELLVGRRLFFADSDAAMMANVLAAQVDPPSKHAPGLVRALDVVTLRALDRDPNKRFATAREMARALEKSVTVASASEVGEWVERMARKGLTERAEWVARMESESAVDDLPSATRISSMTSFAIDEARGASRRDLRIVTPMPSDQLMVTQISTTRAAAPQAKRQELRRRGLRLVLSIASVAVLVSLAVALVSLRTREHGSDVSQATARIALSSPPAPTANAAEPPSPAPAAPLEPLAPFAPEPSVATPLASGSASASAPVTSAPVTSTPVTSTMGAPENAAHPRVAPAAPRASAARECDPPYVIDSAGIKRYKRGCLR